MLALILIFSPMVLHKKFSSTFPTLIDTLVLVYLYLGTYLGDFKSFFDRFWWWVVGEGWWVGLGCLTGCGW